MRKPYGQNTTILLHRTVHRLYNYIFWALGIGHLQVVHNLSISYTMCVGVYSGGGDDDDEISSYIIGMHCFVMF